MNLLDALSKYIAEQSVGLPTHYDWEFNLANFPLSEYESRGSNKYELSRNLRLDINDAIIKKSPLSEQLQFWYVREWGGVRGNSLATLQKYIQLNDSELIALKKKGIATWSKILSIRNPSIYAIYDARVALAINSIQKKYDVENPVMFPLLPSQNRSFVKEATAAIRSSDFFSKIEGDDFYRHYIGLLSESTKNIAGIDLQDAEMILFSKSKELCSVWQ